jgi:transposase
MRGYSLDLRERVLDAVAAGQSVSEVAATFRVAVPTIYRWLTLKRQGHSLIPHTPTGAPRRITASQQELLLAQIIKAPDDTLAQHCQRWQQTTGEVVSQATIWRALRRLNQSRKKEFDGQ